MDRVHPFACPRGHRNVEVGVDRCYCETCDRQGIEPTFPKADLRDLRTEATD